MEEEEDFAAVDDGESEVEKENVPPQKKRKVSVFCRVIYMYTMFRPTCKYTHVMYMYSAMRKARRRQLQGNIESIQYQKRGYVQ